MFQSMAGGKREGSTPASLGVPPAEAPPRGRRSGELLTIPETQLLQEVGLPRAHPRALRVVGISCKEVLRPSGEQVCTGGPGAWSCKEPPEGLAPLRPARSSRLV